MNAFDEALNKTTEREYSLGTARMNFARFAEFRAEGICSFVFVVVAGGNMAKGRIFARLLLLKLLIYGNLLIL